MFVESQPCHASGRVLAGGQMTEHSKKTRVVFSVFYSSINSGISTGRSLPY